MKNRVIMHMPEPAAGSAQYVRELVNGIQDNGAPVVLFCPTNFAYLGDLSQQVTIACSGARGTERAGLLTRVFRNLRFFAATFLKQSSIARKRDIVHFQFPLYFPLGLAFFLLAKAQGCRIVFTAHDPLPHRWLLPERFRFLEKQPRRYAYQLSDRIIVHNQTGKDLIVREFGQPTAKIAVIPHGPFAMEGAAIGFAQRPTLSLLMFGSIRANKGVHLAIEAVQHINAAGESVRLTIAGAVANALEQQYWEECLRLIELAPEGITVVSRFIADNEIPELLGGCHALLLPYLDYGSESGVAAIALANQRPILARNIGSLGTLLGGADLGIAIELPTVEGVEAAIRTAIRNGQEDLRLKGLRGAEFVNSTRSWLDIGRQTVDLYRSVWAG